MRGVVGSGHARGSGPCYPGAPVAADGHGRGIEVVAAKTKSVSLLRPSGSLEQVRVYRELRQFLFLKLLST